MQDLMERPRVTPALNGAGRGEARRIGVLATLTTGLALAFWLGSRYPALGRKAATGVTPRLFGDVGFGSLVAVDPAGSIAHQLAATSVNWLWANFQGMVFGVLMGACLLSLLGLLRDRWQPRTRVGATLAGMLVGAPLGVCVNCAAPIAHGMGRAGARTETALTMMLSSPTFNVVVLSMALASLPRGLVLAKVAVVVLCLLVAMPLLSRVQARGGTSLPDPRGAGLVGSASVPLVVGPQTWSADLRWIGRSLASSLWQVARLTVPLMLLAAVLTAILQVAFDFESLVRQLPPTFSMEGIAALVVLALVTTFLPVPIAFDVVLVAAMWSLGVPAAYVMCAFLCLGIYSVYAGAVVHRTWNLRLAVGVGVGTVVVGVALGLVTQVALDRRDLADRAWALGLVGTAPPAPPVAPTAGPAPTTSPVVWATADLGLSGRVVSVGATPFTSGPVTGRTVVLDGRDVGLHDRPTVDPAMKFTWPRDGVGGASVGDVNDDGRDDVVVTSDQGPRLYLNMGGSFALVAVPSLPAQAVVLAVLVDVDDETGLELVSTYMDGRIAVTDLEAADLAASATSWITGPAEAVGYSLAVDDVEGDGDVDIIVGRLSRARSVAPNLVLRQQADGSFVPEEMPGPHGPTITLLLADLDGDGDRDLVAGNDMQWPDMVRENVDGTFVASEAMKGASTETTMSFTRADLDGDGRIEVLVSQITDATATGAGCLDPGPCRDAVATARALGRSLVDRTPGSCREAPDAATCVRAAFGLGTMQSLLSCEAQDGWMREACLRGALSAEFAPVTGPADPEIGLAQNLVDNLLWRADDGAELVSSIADGEASIDLARGLGLGRLGWTWDTTAYDADNDGDLDLGAANGIHFAGRQDGSMLLRNDGTFSAVEGIGTAEPMTSSVTLDLENDGDMDLLLVPVEGPPQVWRNEHVQTPMVQLELRGPLARGAVVEVRWGGRSFVRTVDGDGGYASFDSTRVHVANPDAIVDDGVTARIVWSDGGVSELTGLQAGTRYRITTEPTNG